MATYTYSVLAKDVKNYERAKTLMSALIINGASTLLLQISANSDARTASSSVGRQGTPPAR